MTPIFEVAGMSTDGSEPVVAKRESRGGRRIGAGRKKRYGKYRCMDVAHRTREPLSAKHPVHVVLRPRVKIEWRCGEYYKHVRLALWGLVGRPDFRVTHVSIQDTHLHLIVEAADAAALSKGMQSFGIRLARSIRSRNGQSGSVFKYRYHATQIRSARQARNAIAYVLNNWRRHGADWVCKEAQQARVDPYSSGALFDGWIGGAFGPAPGNYQALPVARPQTDLLLWEWKRYGLIDTNEVPGPLKLTGPSDWHRAAAQI